MDEASYRFENVLIHGQKGQGAVIQVEGRKVAMVNSTSAQNELPGLNVGSSGVVELQNCILASQSQDELSTISGNGLVISLGGNLVDDTSLMDWLGQQDLEDSDPYFLGGGDYSLTAASPGVDFGVQPDSIYPYDLAGNARIQGKRIDSGAYESPFTSSIEPLEVTRLELWPNPASEWVRISLPKGWSAVKELRIMDVLGAEYRTYSTGSSDGQVPSMVPLNDLPSGTFHIEMVNTNGEHATGTLIHQSGR